MVYYEISFPLTLIFEYIFVEILLMTFIYISISLKVHCQVWVNFHFLFHLKSSFRSEDI